MLGPVCSTMAQVGGQRTTWQYYMVTHRKLGDQISNLIVLAHLSLSLSLSLCTCYQELVKIPFVIVDPIGLRVMLCGIVWEIRARPHESHQISHIGIEGPHKIRRFKEDG